MSRHSYNGKNLDGFPGFRGLEWVEMGLQSNPCQVFPRTEEPARVMRVELQPKAPISCLGVLLCSSGYLYVVS